MRKKNKGEVFEDLSMINELMRKKTKEEKQEKLKKKANHPKIEVLKSEPAENKGNAEEEEKKKEEDPTAQPEPEFIYSYGFNRQFRKFFDDLEEEMLEITDLNPDATSLCSIALLLTLGYNFFNDKL